MPEDKGLAWVECTRVNAGVTKSRERVVQELGLSIVINNKHYSAAMITPGLEKEFVIGHLFGQRIISSIKDIESISVGGNIAEVVLRGAIDKGERPPVIDSNFKVTSADILQGVKAILKSEVFAETEALHSAGLFGRGAEPICLAEDIGRHNALDKVIGFGLLKRIDFGSTFVTSTGRQPAEMISRCCNANIPVIATKGVPTTLAIDLARKAGLTIVGLVRGNSMTVYSNPSRIVQ